MLSHSTITIPTGTFTPLEVPKGTFTPLSPEEDTAFLGQPDERTGAPLNLRAAVASVRRPAQKLAILRKVDPNAQPYGDGNFVYTPPGATQPILFDAKGAGDWGRDIVEGLPMAAEVLGSLGGGLFGGAVGNVPGALGGAALGGGALRDVTEQAMMAATGTQDPRSLPQRAVDVAVTGGASALGEGAGRLLAPVGRMTARAFEGTPTGIATREAAGRLKVPLTAGMETGRRFFQQVEGALAGNPITGGIMSRAVTDATDAATGASRRIVQSIAHGTDTSPPSFVNALRAAGEGAVQRFKDVRQAMADQITAIAGPTASVPLTNVQRVLNELQTLQMRAGGALDPQVSGAIGRATEILDAAQAQGGQLPFDVVQKLRTAVGEAAQFGGFTAERIPGARQGINDLYMAIGEDLREGARLIDSQARAAGLPTPALEQALEAHDAYVRLNRDADALVNIETMERLMGVSPKNPSQWAVSLTRHPETARELRRAIPEREWDTIAGAVFEDMGRATPGAQDVAGEVWSPAQFLANWNRMGQQGREAIFGGSRYAAVADDITALARVAEGIKQGGKFANTSHTANALLVPLMIGTAAGGVGAVFGGAEGAAKGAGVGLGAFGLRSTIGAWAAAKLLTSPRAMHAIRNTVTSGTRHLPSFYARMEAIGRSDPALQAAINEYIAAVGQQLPVPDPANVTQLNTGNPAVQYTPRLFGSLRP